MTPDQPKRNSGGELRPCPWCGSKNHHLGDAINSWVKCLDCGNSLFSDRTGIEDAISKWNSAWCWNEIDRLKMIITKQAIEEFEEKL